MRGIWEVCGEVAAESTEVEVDRVAHVTRRRLVALSYRCVARVHEQC